MAMESTQRSWWGRNWKWIVPVGCVTPLFCCGGGVAAIFLVVFGTLQSSEVYVNSVAKARASKDVIVILGEPIESGLPMGNLDIKNNVGKADLNVPLTGPKGKAQLHVVAAKNGGAWEYTILQVATDAGVRIDLLEPKKE